MEKIHATTMTFDEMTTKLNTAYDLLNEICNASKDDNSFYATMLWLSVDRAQNEITHAVQHITDWQK